MMDFTGKTAFDALDDETPQQLRPDTTERRS
jgi:hypothetical protein